jgi:hypothetical protein
MAQVLTEGTNLAVVSEASLAAATPPTAGWLNLQPNSYGDFGSSFKKIARTPISKNRMNQKGILVDEDSKIPFEHDLTKDLIDQFLEGIFMAATKHSGGTGVSKWQAVATVTSPGAVVLSAVAAGAYTVASGGALTGGAAGAGGTLVYGRGFTNAANNGLNQVAAASTGTSIKVTAAVLEASPPSNATLEIAGWRGATGDLGLDVNGNLTSTTADFTTMGLNVGQWIWVGGTAGSAFAFATAGYRGFARIKSIAAHLLTLERRSWTVAAADTGTGKTIDLYFSRWIRNVANDSADYKQPSFCFEVAYQTLGAGPVPEYEYLFGNLAAEWVINIPLTTKATISASFVGTTTNDPTTARFTGPSTAINPVTNLALSTATDLMRLQVANTDETGISTDFQSIKLTIKNNVEPEKQLGTLGATKMNVGVFEVMLEADVIFTSDQVIVGVHDNRTTAGCFALRNNDFGMLFDLTSMTLDDVNRKLEKNKSVIINTKASGFQDATLGFVLGGSVFAFLPSS